MADELKACPFCGGVAGEDQYDGQYFISCEDCGTSGNLFDRKSIAIEKWNHRPIEDKLQAEIERLTAYCDKMAEAYPNGMLPKDIQVIKDANWTFAQQLHEAQAEIERLRGILRMTYKAIESLPIDALGEGGYSDHGEECRYPIRDEVLNTIAGALKAELAAREKREAANE